MRMHEIVEEKRFLGIHLYDKTLARLRHIRDPTLTIYVNDPKVLPMIGIFALQWYMWYGEEPRIAECYD